MQLTVEEYVAAMQVLVHDVRFTLYNVCYKRLLLVWVLLGFFILLCLLFSGVRGLALFGGGVVWLVVNAMGIFVCMWLKFKVGRKASTRKETSKGKDWVVGQCPVYFVRLPQNFCTVNPLVVSDKFTLSFLGNQECHM